MARDLPTEDSRAREHRALLQIWLSPSFPVGAYAYSHGLETAVGHGWITDRASLESWLADLVGHGSLRNDLVLLAAAFSVGRVEPTRDPTFRAPGVGSREGLDPTYGNLADLAAALQPSAERYLEATQQGRSFVQQIDAAWPLVGLSLAERFGGAAPTLAVALGVAARAKNLPLDATLIAYAVAFVSNLISAAIRLGVVGQTDGQRTLAALLPLLSERAAKAATSTLDDLGGATFRADIAAMHHETQYTRMFRS